MGKGHSDGQYQAGVIAPIFHKSIAGRADVREVAANDRRLARDFGQWAK